MSRTDSIFVLKVKTPEEREACFAVRRAVFVEEQKFDAETEIDEYDKTALHLLAMHNGKPVGTARIIFKDQGQIVKVTRVAVLKEVRKFGVGRALMAAIEELPEAQQAAKFVLSSQIHAIPFYERVGYSVEGDEYVEDGAPHRFMFKDNQKSPANQLRAG